MSEPSSAQPHGAGGPIVWPVSIAQLRDTTLSPDDFTPIQDAHRSPSGLDLDDPRMAAVLNLSRQAADLMEQRSSLIDQLRDERYHPPVPANAWPASLGHLRDTALAPDTFTPITDLRRTPTGLDLTRPLATSIHDVSTRAADALQHRGMLLAELQAAAAASTVPAWEPAPAPPAPQPMAARPATIGAAESATACPAPATPQPVPPVGQPAPAAADAAWLAPASASTANPAPEAAPSPRSRFGLQIFLLVIGIALLTAAAVVFAIWAYTVIGDVPRAISIAVLGFVGLGAAWFLARNLRITAEGIAWAALLAFTTDSALIAGTHLLGSDLLVRGVFGGGLVIASALALGFTGLRARRGDQPRPRPLRAATLYPAFAAPLGVALLASTFPGSGWTQAWYAFAFGALALLAALAEHDSTLLPRFERLTLTIIGMGSLSLLTFSSVFALATESGAWPLVRHVVVGALWAASWPLLLRLRTTWPGVVVLPLAGVATVVASAPFAMLQLHRPAVATLVFALAVAVIAAAAEAMRRVEFPRTPSDARTIRDASLRAFALSALGIQAALSLQAVAISVVWALSGALNGDVSGRFDEQALTYIGVLMLAVASAAWSTWLLAPRLAPIAVGLLTLLLMVVAICTGWAAFVVATILLPAATIVLTRWAERQPATEPERPAQLSRAAGATAAYGRIAAPLLLVLLLPMTWSAGRWALLVAVIAVAEYAAWRALALPRARLWARAVGTGIVTVLVYQLVFSSSLLTHTFPALDRDAAVEISLTAAVLLACFSLLAATLWRLGRRNISQVERGLVSAAGAIAITTAMPVALTLGTAAGTVIALVGQLLLLVVATICWLPDQRPALRIIPLIAAAAASLVLLATNLDSGYLTPAELPALLFAAAALAVGALWMRERAQLRSWPVLSAGLGALLLPTLLLTWTEGSLTRNVLLAAAALAVLLTGTALRWQAPVINGGSVLLLHVIVQSWPYLSDFNREFWWVWLAIGGVLLILVAAFFERSIRTVKTLGQRVRALR
ncbi:MAG: hypothetical protein ABF811_04225 [Pseudoclavibacter sp.]